MENSKYICNNLTALLNQNNVEVITSTDTAKEAFNQIATHFPDFIFLDVSFLDLSPTDMVRGIMAISRRLTVVILAPLTKLKEVSILLRIGAFGYLPKPFVPSQIETLILAIQITKYNHDNPKLYLIEKLYNLFFTKLFHHASKQHKRKLRQRMSAVTKKIVKEQGPLFQIDKFPLKIIPGKNIENATYSLQVILAFETIYKKILEKAEALIRADNFPSFLQDVYEFYYREIDPISHLIDYQLPKWKEYEFNQDKFVRIEMPEKALTYLKALDYSWPNNLKFATNFQKLQTYSVTINHDPRITSKLNTFAKAEPVKVYGIYSLFDEILGPQNVFTYPPITNSFDKEQLQVTSQFLDLTGVEEFEPFLHASEVFASINLIFTSQRTESRGETLYQMITIATVPLNIQAIGKLTKMKTILNAVAKQIAEEVSELKIETLFTSFDNPVAKIMTSFVQDINRHLHK